MAAHLLLLAKLHIHTPLNNNQPMVINHTSHQFTPQYNQSSTKSLHIRHSRVLEWQVIYSYLTNYTYIHPSATINPQLVTTHLINSPLNTTNLLHNPFISTIRGSLNSGSFTHIPNYTYIHPSTTIHPRLITTHLMYVLLNTTNLLHNPFISAVRRSLNGGSFTLTCQITHTYTPQQQSNCG